MTFSRRWADGSILYDMETWCLGPFPQYQYNKILLPPSVRSYNKGANDEIPNRPLQMAQGAQAILVLLCRVKESLFRHDATLDWGSPGTPCFPDGHSGTEATRRSSPIG